jgi:hypothetical protein
LSPGGARAAPLRVALLRAVLRELSSRPAGVNPAGPHPQVLGPEPKTDDVVRRELLIEPWLSQGCAASRSSALSCGSSALGALGPRIRVADVLFLKLFDSS